MLPGYPFARGYFAESQCGAPDKPIGVNLRGAFNHHIVTPNGVRQLPDVVEGSDLGANQISRQANA